MAMEINQNYSQFYKGTEPLKTYGSGDIAAKKDTLVKYEFKTTDEDGNKVMDKMTREETLQAMKEISSQYGDNVIVEFSGDGMAALIQGKQGKLLDEIMKPDPEKQAQFEKEIVHLENTHRIIIPNIQTNAKLYNSLEGADEMVVKATTGIIKNYLMPHDVSGMSEKERQDAIAFGLEEARYLANNYLDKEKAGEFLSAMETIAKYGSNGVVSEDGKVTYNIEKGPLVSAPDDYVNEMDILKEKAPDLYKEIQELNSSIINHKPGEKYGTKFLELFKRAQKVLDSSSDGKTTNREAAVKKYADWKEEIEKTKLPDTFQNVDYKDVHSFFASLQNQSSLSASWLNDSMERFMKWLDGGQ